MGWLNNYKNDWQLHRRFGRQRNSWRGLDSPSCTAGTRQARCSPLFAGMDNLIKWQLITYESHPFNFVSLFAIYVLVAAVGLAACVGQYLRIRKWYGQINRKPTTE